MNASERKVLCLAFCLFVLGVLVRILPWGLPSIESIQIEDSPQQQSEPRNDFVANKVTENEGGVSESNFDSNSPKSEKTSRKSSKKKNKVTLPLHINVATAEELCALNGVGPKLAEKIIAHRDASGPFKNPKDLEKVPGIGKKKLESILPGVIFD